MANICIDLGTFESLFQVVVNCIVGDLADQRQIGNANLLLLGDFEGGFLGLGRAARSSLLGVSGGFVLGTS